ncbi:MAG: efflux RND transporter periplasmic adaptor subunit [Chromatiales bacterium]|nr:MAG: efflux RND transporter periplasmic adaptor subunit [Chromatiales bacterium]
MPDLGLQAIARAWRTLAALAAACVLLWGCGGPEPESAGPGMGGMGGRGSGRPVSVIVTRVEPRTFVDRFTGLGTARATESIQVTSRISSVVERIGFEEGQQVKAGQLLIELDHAELEAELAMAEASLQKARSQFERRRGLAATRVISELELEELEAEVLIAEADVRASKARLDNAFIRAPFGGTVGLRTVSLGDLVGPETMITTLDDTATIKLEFTIPETFLATVQKGTRIDARSEVYPESPFTGEVSIVDPRVDQATRSVTVIARLPNPDGLIKPGMFLTVDLQREREDVLVVPEQALAPRQGRQYLYTVEDGTAVEKEVSLGARAPGLAEVREGLAPGTLVITEGTQKVRNGAPVQVSQGG